jgi:hypothetical protein
MPVMNGKSCYVLELSVQPGGARWAELHTYTDLGHIRLCLERFCKNEGGFAAYVGIFYGATLAIWVVQRGEVTQVIDLHDHLRAHFDGQSVPLSDRKALAPMREQQEDNEGDELMPGVSLSLLWDDIEVKLQALSEPLLAPGESTTVKQGPVGRGMETYLPFGDPAQIGSIEVESGEELEPPVPIAGIER